MDWNLPVRRGDELAAYLAAHPEPDDEPGQAHMFSGEALWAMPTQGPGELHGTWAHIATLGYDVTLATPYRDGWP